jgi:hypothetical protein
MPLPVEVPSIGKGLIDAFLGTCANQMQSRTFKDNSATPFDTGKGC